MPIPSPKIKSSTASARALLGIWTILLTTFIIASLFLARDILIPVALAALLTFLLAPIVTALQRWLGRIGAVLLVVLVILGVAAGGGYLLTSQLVDLASKLPDYQNNIEAKMRAFKPSAQGRFSRLTKTVEQLRKEFPGATETPAAAVPVPLPSEIPVEPSPSATAPVASLPAVPVQVVNSPVAVNPFHIVSSIISPLLGPIGTGALVLLLVIFMLLKREDLRSRIIRLIGQGRISVTTKAMDDASSRVTRYLLMQLIVNVSYGVMVAIGLYFIGVPNAVLWGASATVLRFIPYVGPWIGAALPVGLALAVSPSWSMPLMTLGLFIVLELLSNNVMEPWLYGSSTGVTPVALILAALFWTWLWGPVGLVLATPMTVCLVVMGRHIPRLSFLGVLLSDEQALTPAEDCYYRLLTVGEEDEIELVESYLKANSLAALYDSVLIPVVTTIETDHRLEVLDDDQRTMVEQSLRDIVRDLGERPRPEVAVAAESGSPAAPTETAARLVYCLPARAERDELAGEMLAQLLKQQGVPALSAPVEAGADELVKTVQKSNADVVCISVVAPSTVLHARHLCLKLRQQLPRLTVIVGLWGSTENVSEAIRRVKESGADLVLTTLGEAVAAVASLGSVPSEVGVDAPRTGTPLPKEAAIAA